MENNKFVIRKVPLRKFVSLLNELYLSGADFVDLRGYINEVELQDNVTVSVPIEYMSEESQAEGSDMEEEYDPGPLPPPGIEEEEKEENVEITEKEIIDLLNHV